MSSQTKQPAEGGRKRLTGVVAGPAVFAALLLAPPPGAVTAEGWSVAALAALMAIWWLTEALPLAATALAPVVLAPLLGVAPIEQVAQSYAHPLIFLFLGGFLIARALERWDLHRVVARAALRVGARSPAGLVGSVMVTTAFLSMWISNTAATMVMAPIALAVTRSAQAAMGPGRGGADLAAATMLGVAFSATVGGMATLIGTPPNALLAGYLQSAYGMTIGFGQWMLVGVPIMLCLLAMSWLVLTRTAFRFGDAAPLPAGAMIDPDAAARPRLRPGARRTAAIVIAAGLALVLRPALAALAPGLPLSDAGIVMAAALALFALPAGDGAGGRLLNWDEAQGIRWDVLILFGGGLALAGAIDASGLSQAIGALIAAPGALPMAVIVLLAMAMIVALGELASNTAMAAVFLPVAGAAAAGLGVAPLDLVLPIGLAASLGFMLPVATPPNAIAYGTGAFTSGQMMRAGALLDVLSVPVVYVIALSLGRLVLGP